MDFDEAVAGADRVTVAVTLFALLELYKQGEADVDPGHGLRADRDRRGHRADSNRNGGARRMSLLSREIEALLFLSAEPVPAADLAEATGADAEELQAALAELGEAYAPGERGLLLRELAGGWTLVSAPETEEAARRLLAKPRTPPLTPAQAETLAIVAYLQPVSRPEITRIRGVSADSAAGTLLERGLIEESGRSQFGAVLYRTTPLFLKLFGLAAVGELPDPGPLGPGARRGGRAARAPAQGRRHAGGGQPRPPTAGRVEPAETSPASAFAASWPQAASMSRPRVSLTVAL